MNGAKNNIIWQPQAKQALFQSRQEYEVLYGGAAGGGKSDALLTEALRQVHKPNYRALILRKTVPQLRDIIDRSLQLYSAAFPNALYKSVEHVWQFKSGAKIYFGSMHRPNDRYQYQGQRFDYIAFDELTHFTYEEYFYMLSRNRPGDSGMRVYMRASANPGGIGHAWVKARFIDPAPPLCPIYSDLDISTPQGETIKLKRSRVFVPSTVFENHALMQNAPHYIASLAMLPEADKKALLYGDWNSFQGQVFTEFKNDPLHYGDGINSHVIEPINLPKHLPAYRGFDFGYTRPYGVGWFILDDDGIIYMVNELYGGEHSQNIGNKNSPVEIASQIRDAEKNSPLLRGRNIIGIADPSIFDESRGESIARMMEYSPNFIYFAKGDNTRLAGKMQVHNRLKFDRRGRAKLYIFKNCRNMIRTLPNLIYSQSRVEDVDTDGEDHLYDVLRYVLMEKPISGLKAYDNKPVKSLPIELRI